MCKKFCRTNFVKKFRTPVFEREKRENPYSGWRTYVWVGYVARAKAYMVERIEVHDWSVKEATASLGRLATNGQSWGSPHYGFALLDFLEARFGSPKLRRMEIRTWPTRIRATSRTRRQRRRWMSSGPTKWSSGDIATTSLGGFRGEFSGARSARHLEALPPTTGSAPCPSKFSLRGPGHPLFVSPLGISVKPLHS